MDNSLAGRHYKPIVDLCREYLHLYAYKMIRIELDESLPIQDVSAVSADGARMEDNELEMFSAQGYKAMEDVGIEEVRATTSRPTGLEGDMVLNTPPRSGTDRKGNQADAFIGIEIFQSRGSV